MYYIIVVAYSFRCFADLMQTVASETEQVLFLFKHILKPSITNYNIFGGKLELEGNEERQGANMSSSRPWYGQVLLIQDLFKMRAVSCVISILFTIIMLFGLSIPMYKIKMRFRPLSSLNQVTDQWAFSLIF